MTKNQESHVYLAAGAYFPHALVWLALKEETDLDSGLCDWQVFVFPFVALEIGADLPSNHVIDRWLGEPIKAAILPTSIFLTNKKGFPVLSKMHQRLIFRLLKVCSGRVLTVFQLILFYSYTCDGIFFFLFFFPLWGWLFLSNFWSAVSAKLGALRTKEQIAVEAPETFQKESGIMRTLQKVWSKKFQQWFMGSLVPGDAYVV